MDDKMNNNVKIFYFVFWLAILVSFIVYVTLIFPHKKIDEYQSTVTCDDTIVFTFYNADIHTKGSWDESRYQALLKNLCLDPTHVKGEEKALVVSHETQEKNYVVNVVYTTDWASFENNLINGILMCIVGLIMLNALTELIVSRDAHTQFNYKNLVKFRKF
jgi:hypothetical protein